MPRRDRTGLKGKGPGTGRGMGRDEGRPGGRGGGFGVRPGGNCVYPNCGERAVHHWESTAMSRNVQNAARL